MRSAVHSIMFRIAPWESLRCEPHIPEAACEPVCGESGSRGDAGVDGEYGRGDGGAGGTAGAGVGLAAAAVMCEDASQSQDATDILDDAYLYGD